MVEGVSEEEAEDSEGGRKTPVLGGEEQLSQVLSL